MGRHRISDLHMHANLLR